MSKTIFQKIFVIATIVFMIATLFSCHPDSPDEFIDYTPPAPSHSNNYDS